MTGSRALALAEGNADAPLPVDKGSKLVLFFRSNLVDGWHTFREAFHLRISHAIASQEPAHVSPQRATRITARKTTFGGRADQIPPSDHGSSSPFLFLPNFKLRFSGE